MYGEPRDVLVPLTAKRFTFPSVSKAEVVPETTMQKIGQKLLKLEAVSVVDKDEFQFDAIQHYTIHNLIDNILDLERADLIYRDEIERIVIGRDMYEKMMDHACDNPWDSKVEIEMSGPMGFRVIGIPVQYVPWMCGWVLLPRMR